MAKPVQNMTDKEIADELEHIAKILGRGPVGSSYYSASRAAAVIRRAAKRLKLK